jgi:hypothetical protein
MDGHKMSIREAQNNCEVWRCPECDRVLIIDWKRIDTNPITVISRGNDNIVHYGSKGGLDIGNIEVAPNVALTADDRQWLASLDIDDS